MAGNFKKAALLAVLASACHVQKDGVYDTADALESDTAVETDTAQNTQETGNDTGDTDSDSDALTETDTDTDTDLDTGLFPFVCEYDPLPENSLPMPNLQGLVGNMEFIPVFNGYDVVGNTGSRTTLGVFRYDANEAPIIYGRNLVDPINSKQTPVLDANLNPAGYLEDYLTGLNPNGEEFSLKIVPIGTADIDGDWVDEIFTHDGYYKKEGGYWVSHPFINTLSGTGCDVGMETAIFHDQNGDGLVDIILPTTVSSYACSMQTGPAFVLTQDLDGNFTPDYTLFQDTLRPQIAQHLQAKSGMLLQTKVGGQVVIGFAAETYAPGFSSEAINLNGWENSGLYYWNSQNATYESVSPLEPNAYTRLEWDYYGLADFMGVQNAYALSEQALITELALILNVPLQDLFNYGLDQVIELINAELEPMGNCIDDFLIVDPNRNIESFTPMGIASADFDRDGILEFGISTTWNLDIIPYNTQKHFEFDSVDPYLLYDRTEDLSLHMPNDRWTPQSDGFNDIPSLQGGLPDKNYGWGIYLAADITKNGYDDVFSTNGRDFDDHSNPYFQRKFVFEIYASTGQTLPGKKIPAVRRATTEVFPNEYPPYSDTDDTWDDNLRDGVSLCVVDLDEDGNLDYFVGTDYNTDGYGGNSDGGDPVIILDHSDSSKSFTVRLNITSADYWVLAHYPNSASVQRQAIPYSTEGIFCHSDLMFGPSPSGELPSQIEVLDLAGNQVTTVNNPATGRLHKITVTP